nr:EOG090X0IV9 [Eurycercus lamellatus]
MADKLGLGSEVKELRLGSSFTNSRGSAFHTFRYDFKPASVDTSKMATVDILPNNEVNVTVPHCDGAGTAQTSMFRGPKKPYAKECVLIIDHNTGEITLERLSHNIQLKKTRAEGTGKAGQSLSPEGAMQQTQSTQSYQSHSSKKASPVQKSPPSSYSSATPSPPYSMPMLDDLDLGLGTVAPATSGFQESLFLFTLRGLAVVGVLSDSSSDSGSDSSSDSSGSDSDSDMDKTLIPIANGRGSSSSLTVARETVSTNSSNASLALSMPSHLLSEDLRLSDDSASDSD